jgi:hypothetical protein
MENIIPPLVSIERDMGPVGADIPAVTQDDPDDAVDTGKSCDSAAVEADTIYQARNSQDSEMIVDLGDSWIHYLHLLML